MQDLHEAGRTNVIYSLTKCLGTKRLGTKRSDRSDSLMPTARMPMGLVVYMFNFYFSSIQKVRTLKISLTEINFLLH